MTFEREVKEALDYREVRASPEYTGGMLINSPVIGFVASDVLAKNGDIVVVDTAQHLGTGRIIKVYKPDWQKNEMAMITYGRAWLIAPLSACSPINQQMEA